tara:strand:- start:2749 stop:3507 length:759 start_codon:yes stop_codon:yes gene_type:complete
MSLHSELVEIQSQPSTGQLAKALAAFQKQHHAAKRTGVVAAQVNPEKPRYNRPERKFSNLEDILEAIKPAAEHGLSHTETWHVIGTEHAVLRVTLRHTSGEQITSEWPMDMNAALNTSKEQARGSSQTYARRYLLMGIYGIVGADKDEADDDGESTKAQDVTPKQQQSDAAKSKQQPAPSAPARKGVVFLTDEQRKEIKKTLASVPEENRDALRQDFHDHFKPTTAVKLVNSDNFTQPRHQQWLDSNIAKYQ